jgi:hypothetical protein
MRLWSFCASTQSSRRSARVVLAKIGAAIAALHPWVVIACDSCDSLIDLDLRMKRRDPEASISVVLHDVRCPRCNGHGRPRIAGLAHQTGK